MIGHNLQFTTDQFDVDKINARFYGKIKFPWPPQAFEKITRKDFWRRMLAQDLGFWHDDVLPKNAKIWVAGCGTNQAIFTALKFPDSYVIGSDLSLESLEECKKNATQLNIKNLELRKESINKISYISKFDYIISTGVIHHNSNPEDTLKKLSNALKPSGIMELMVYNKFHRIATSAFQIAVRMLAPSINGPDVQQEFSVARMIVDGYRGKNNKMNELLESMKYAHPAAFSDSLLQPVEYSYTIETLNNMVLECNLQLLSFCQDQFSRSEGNFDWNLRFEDSELQNLYDKLPDLKRWYITNLLQGESSPWLWFYLQKKNCPRLRKSENEMCQEFLNLKFKHIQENKEVYLLNEENGTYEIQPLNVSFPVKKHFISEEINSIYSKLNQNATMAEILEKCGISPSFSKINLIRACLATSGSPYLEAIK